MFDCKMCFCKYWKTDEWINYYKTRKNKLIINYKDSETVFGICRLHCSTVHLKEMRKVKIFKNLLIFVSRLAFESLYCMKFLI